MKMNFLIIGAQKSATTALFKYLQPHPFLAMPEAKELPLFTEEVSDYEAGKFIAQHFPGQIGKLRGKATPQYMCDEKVPGRIFKHNPDMKLIAVLRDPIERAWSHFRMNRRRETESREFEQAMLDCLSPEALARGRSGSAPNHELCFESEADYYLAWGEYGRILKQYLKFFSEKQLLVIYTFELQQRPEQTLDKILGFLGLEAGFRPSCLGEVVHKGGTERLISSEAMRAVRNCWPVRQIWDRIPEARKNVIRYWIEQKNVRASDEAMTLSDATYAKLQSHFAKDARLLAELSRTHPMWV